MLWWFDSTRPHLVFLDQGDVAQPDEHLACNEEDVGSTPTVSTFASVVSTASTRPLYGRGVGSNPAGGSSRPWPRSAPAGRSPAPPSARAARGTGLSGAVFKYCPLRPGTASDAPGTGGLQADVAQTEEHRSATPGRPVRSGSSALEGLWCKRQHGELQPRWSGFDPWRACFTPDRRGPERLGYLVRAVAHACAVAVRLRFPTASHDRDVLPCCGPEQFRLSTPNRQVAGSSPARSTSCSGSSVGRAVPGCTTTTAAVL